MNNNSTSDIDGWMHVMDLAAKTGIPETLLYSYANNRVKIQGEHVFKMLRTSPYVNEEKFGTWIQTRKVGMLTKNHASALKKWNEYKNQEKNIGIKLTFTPQQEKKMNDCFKGIEPREETLAELAAQEFTLQRKIERAKHREAEKRLEVYLIELRNTIIRNHPEKVREELFKSLISIARAPYSSSETPNRQDS